MTHLADSGVSEFPFKQCATLSRLDTPLPLLGRRRSSLLAGLHQGLHGLETTTAAPTGSLPSFHRKRLRKRRSSSSSSSSSWREGSTRVSREFAEPPLGVANEVFETPPRSSFSPYSPLPAIGAPSAVAGRGGGAVGDMVDTDTDADERSSSFDQPPRLLRERTYDVLEPRFVRGPGQGLAPVHVPGIAPGHVYGPPSRFAHGPTPGLSPGLAPGAGLPPRLSSGPLPGLGPGHALGLGLGPGHVLNATHHEAWMPAGQDVGAMIEDEELPTSPPAVDDEDLEGEDVAGTTAYPTANSSGLQALKEGYKGKLKKFWAKF